MKKITNQQLKEIKKEIAKIIVKDLVVELHRKCQKTLSGKHSFEEKKPTYYSTRYNIHACKYCGRYKNK